MVLSLVDLTIGVLGRIVVSLGLHKLHPNSYTLTGLILAILTPITAYLGYWSITVTLMAISALMDVLDGLVARIAGRQTTFGAFLDSLSDRISDASYILALSILGVNQLLCYLLLVASYLVSYARARGEGLGVKLKGVGLIERQERVITLILAGLLVKVNISMANLILGMLLALSMITLIQRVYHVYREIG